MAEKIRPHPLKGKFREVAQVTVSGNGIAGPITVVQNGKKRILRLSKRHQKLDQNLILALLGSEWMTELSA